MFFSLVFLSLELQGCYSCDMGQGWLLTFPPDFLIVRPELTSPGLLVESVRTPRRGRPPASHSDGAMAKMLLQVTLRSGCCFLGSRQLDVPEWLLATSPSDGDRSGTTTETLCKRSQTTLFACESDERALGLRKRFMNVPPRALLVLNHYTVGHDVLKTRRIHFF